MTLTQWPLLLFFWAVGGLLLAFVVAQCRSYEPMTWRYSRVVAFLAACGPLIWLMAAYLLWSKRK